MCMPLNVIMVRYGQVALLFRLACSFQIVGDWLATSISFRAGTVREHVSIPYVRLHANIMWGSQSKARHRES